MFQDKKDKKKHDKELGDDIEKIYSTGELSECELKCLDLENKYKRALADYQNLLKQTAKDRQEFIIYANEELIMDFMPVYENLKLAVNHSNGKEEENEWLQGIKYVIKQFQEVLKNYNVEEIKTVGEKFDHNLMEALEKEETENEEDDGLVARELSPGYLLNGKVIKAARVVVYEARSV